MKLSVMLAVKTRVLLIELPAEGRQLGRYGSAR
jgi:hypothetical protein